MKKLLAKAKEAVGIESSGKSFSDEMKVASEEGALAKRLVTDLHAKLDRQVRLLEQMQAIGTAFRESFADSGASLMLHNAKLAAQCNASAEWQVKLGEFEFSLQHGVQQLRDNCKSFLDTELVAAKKAERVYEASRKTLESAENKFRQAGASGPNGPALQTERDAAKRSLERDEVAALNAWRHANSRALALIEASLSSYWKNQASFFKQGGLFFADKRKDADSIFASTVTFVPSASSADSADGGGAGGVGGGGAGASAAKLVFGEPLGDTVPPFLPHTIAYLEEHALRAEGLLRISGSTSAVQQFRSQVNAGHLPQFHPLSDHHNAAGLLKLFLRELPDPLCTYAKYDDWVRATEVSDELERIVAMRSVWQSLPRANRDIMQVLFRFCSKLMEHAADNKMSASNIAIVIGPPILRCRADGDGPGLASDMNAVNKLANDLCIHFDAVFGAGGGGGGGGGSAAKTDIDSATRDLDNIDDLLSEADGPMGYSTTAPRTTYGKLPSSDSPRLGRELYGQLPKNSAIAAGRGANTGARGSAFTGAASKNPFRPAGAAELAAAPAASAAGASAPAWMPKSLKSLLQACGIVAMALQRAPAAFSAAARDEALRVARDIGKHTAALGDGVEGADAVVRESSALVTALSSGEPTTSMLQDSKMQSRRVTCAVHDLLVGWENAVQRTIATRATEATHATASDISALLRSAIAKQDAPEQREGARRNCAQLEALMVARSLQVSDADVLADVATQCRTARQAMDEFLDDLGVVATAAVVDSSIVEGLKLKAKTIITALKQLSQHMLSATSERLLADDEGSLVAGLGAACESAVTSLPMRDEQLRVLQAQACEEPLMAFAKQASDGTLAQPAVVANYNKLVAALSGGAQSPIADLGGEAVGWFALRNAQLAVGGAQLPH